MPFYRTFRALRNKNYRIYFFGELVSMVGSWMQSVVQAWLVYHLTGSAQWLGFVSAANGLPAFMVSPLAGVVADRFERRKILLIVDLIQMIQALTFAALVFTGLIQPWHIAVLSAVLGLSTGFEVTTRHSMAADIVEKAELFSVISLNSIIMNASRILGPALAGICLAHLGEGACFLINGLSYLAVIYSLLLMKLRPRTPSQNPERRVIRQFQTAIAYIVASPRILRLLLLSAFMSFLVFPYAVLLPVYAKEILYGDAQTLAWLTSISGIGSILGVLTLGARPVRNVETRIFSEIALTGAAIALLGNAQTLGRAIFAILMVGFFLMSVFPKINTTIQEMVEDSMRGRVISVYTMTFLGSFPLGSFLAGALADRFGVAHVLGGIGGICVVTGSLLLCLQRLHCFSSPRTGKIEA